MANDFGEFERLIQPHLGRWEGIDTRILATDGGDQCENVLTHAILRYRRPPSPGNSLVRISPRLVALTYWIPIGEVRGFMETLSGGEICTETLKVSFRSAQRPYSFTLVTLLRDSPFGGAIEAPALSVIGSGPALNDVVGVNWSQTILGELRAATVPFESVSDFMVSFLDWRVETADERLRDSASIVISAPLGIGLGDGCRLSGGEIEARVVSDGLIPCPGTQVGIVGSGRGGVQLRETKRLSAEDWARRDERWLATVKWAVEGLLSATLLLSVNGQFIEARTVRDEDMDSPNPKAIALEWLDPHLARVLNLLRGQGKGREQAPDFEAAVCLLLHMAGFSVAPCSLLSRLTDGPDALAFVGELPLVVVAECTTQVALGAKLSKLQRRAKELEECLPEYRVWPVLFAPAPQQQIVTMEFEMARKEEIGLMAREDLEALFTLAVRGAPRKEVLMFFHNVMRRTSW